MPRLCLHGVALENPDQRRRRLLRIGGPAMTATIVLDGIIERTERT